MNTNFQNKKVPKGKMLCKCLPIIMLDYVNESDNKYYPQNFQKNVNMYKKR